MSYPPTTKCYAKQPPWRTYIECFTIAFDFQRESFVSRHLAHPPRVMPMRPMSWVLGATLAGAGFGACSGLIEMAALHSATGMFELPTAVASAVYGALAFAGIGIVVGLLGLAAFRVEAIGGRARIFLLAGTLLASLLLARWIVDGKPIDFVVGPGPGLLFATASASGMGIVVYTCLRARPAPTASIVLATLLAATSAIYAPFLIRLSLGERLGGAWYVMLVAVTAIATATLFRAAARLRPRHTSLGILALLLLPGLGRLAAGPPPYLRVLHMPDGPPATAARRRAPLNVILIVLDTVRADHLELYGYERATMPHLTAFAKGARVYRNCVANAPWSLPAHVTLFTGLYPRQHGARYGWASGRRPTPQPLSPERPTLAELLRERGYTTAAISSNSAFVSADFGLDRGFGYFDSRPALLGAAYRTFLPTLFRSQPIVDKFPIRWILEPLARYDVGQVWYRRAAEIRRLVEAWLGEVAGHREPFFLFVNVMDAHDPYRAPGEFSDFFPGRRRDWPRDRSRHAMLDGAAPDEVRRHVSSQYDSALRYLDSQLAQLLDYLAESDLLDRSMVLITADHGEQFLEHDNLGHAQSVYQEEVHVPLIIHDPAADPEVIPHSVEQRDLVPWILERLDFPLPPGVQASQLGTGRGMAVSEFRHSALGPEMRMQNDSWALVRSGDRGDELFDLFEDPAEQHDVAASRPEVAEELREELTSWARQFPESSSSAVEVDARALHQLTELGYASPRQ